MTVKEKIFPAEFKEAISSRYLSYAVSTIVSRALPDVRDGLKPVQRRILYAMRQLKLDEKSPFKKCARVVGDVMGKYHPHGDASIYEAMVHLAQDFATRYPLVDGQGNFGNIDGDSQAAMRYTEARLTKYASLLMNGLDDDTVDFIDNYSGEDVEPAVMPAAFPNILANGTTGIAVGISTSIPPHNLGELFDALSYLIKNPECTVAELMKFVKGPDFPTGGVIVESKENLAKIYENGIGNIRVRAKWEKEELSHGLYQIVVTEIPYQVKKSDLIEKIANLLLEKKLPLLSDIRDESTDKIRIVLEPRSRSVDPVALMESLFRQSKMQQTCSFNMYVLNKNVSPQIMSLKDVLNAFVEHRMNVLIRKMEYRLAKIDARIEILAGLLVAYLNLDEVIAIIRSEDEPKAVLMKRFKINDNQAEAVLNMKLRSLRKLEEVEINAENKKLSTERGELVKILGDESLRYEKIAAEFSEMKKLVQKDKRRTIFGEVPAIDTVTVEEAVIEKEQITVAYSKKGWIRAVKGFVNASELKCKDDDELQFSLHCYTTDKINFFANNGKFYTILADRISRGRGFGEAIRFLIDLPPESHIMTAFIHNDDDRYLLASFYGKGFVVKASDVVSQIKGGRAVMNIKDGDYPIFAGEVGDRDMIAVVGQNRRMLIFPVADIPVISRGQGVLLLKADVGGISDVRLFGKEKGLIYKTAQGVEKIVDDISPWLGRRASKGSIVMPNFPRTNKFE